MYVESYVTPVKADRLGDYRALAAKAAPIWRRHGALSVLEAVADHAPVGEVTSFPRAVQLQEGEIVVVAFVTFAGRAARDAAMSAAEADPEFMGLMDMTIMDGRRMIWGGFAALVAEGAVAG
jgi:uncharacterized protein YbaA (DUF1428 family)